jgi:hypothetical protein
MLKELESPLNNEVGRHVDPREVEYSRLAQMHLQVGDCTRKKRR